MSNPEVCVAAVDLQRLTSVRLLQWNHHNWPKELAANGIQPGRVVRQRIRSIQDRHGFPHQTEDTQLTDSPDSLDLVPEPQLFADLHPVVDTSINDMFSGNLQEDRYIVDGTHCRSLGSILSPAESLEVFVSDFGKMRLMFSEQHGRSFTLPITDLRVAEDQASGFDYTKRRIMAAQKNADNVLLRVGLARGFDGKGKWSPKRCYLQVNGIIFPS